MWRYVAPAGTPVGPRELMRAGIGCFSSNRETLLERISKRLGVRYSCGLVSGRAALWLVLKALHKLSPKRNVVAVPAYTCFSVAASVARAGLKLSMVDVLPESLELDYDQIARLPDENLLAVITANLFGYVNDVELTKRLAHDKGAFLIDDAAQAMGATRDGYSAGTAGDAGIFSFDRGKPLAAGAGGLVTTNNQHIAEELQAAFRQVPEPSHLTDVKVFCNVLSSSVFLNSMLYRIPNSMPLLKLGTTTYDPNFPVMAVSDLALSLVTIRLDNLNKANDLRRSKASQIRAALGGRARFVPIEPPPNCSPTYIRHPVLALNSKTRSEAIAKLCSAGIGATPYYPSTLFEIPGVIAGVCNGNDCWRGARELSMRLLTLPTHSFVTDRDIGRMADVLGSI